MTTWLITRHRGAMEWIARKGVAGYLLMPHLDLALVQRGDVVIGTLPVYLAAEVGARGARFFNLSIETPLQIRGQELSADDLERYGAKIEEYRVEKLPTSKSLS